MKRILFATLPNKKIIKKLCFTQKEYEQYSLICKKNNYLPMWIKNYQTYEEIEKELLKNDKSN